MTCAETCVHVHTVRRWVQGVKESDLFESCLDEQGRSERLVSASNLKNQVRIDDTIRANRRVKQKKNPPKLKLGNHKTVFIASSSIFEATRKVSALGCRKY